MKYFFVFIMSLVILWGCGEDILYNLPKGHEILFKEGDTIMYSYKNDIDTFIIISKTIQYYQEDNYSKKEVQTVKYQKISDSRNYKISNNLSSFSILWGNVHSTLLYPKNVETYIIDNISIDSVYKIEDPYINDPLDSISHVELFYANKYGIIAYKHKTGNLYEIDVKRLSEKTK